MCFRRRKIKENTINFEEINIILKSDHKTIAEIIPESSGEFKLSGSLISDSFSMELNKKIKSFSASKAAAREFGFAKNDDSRYLLNPIEKTFPKSLWSKKMAGFSYYNQSNLLIDDN